MEHSGRSQISGSIPTELCANGLSRDIEEDPMRGKDQLIHHVQATLPTNLVFCESCAPSVRLLTF